jgi:GT2 family glycosyltransferase
LEADQTQAALAQVTILVVSFNSAHCMPALGRMLKDCPHVVVVDNGSHDNSPSVAQSCLPQAQCLSLGNNFGFGVANNKGLERVTTPYALLLNPDCMIETNVIVQLVKAAAQWPEAAMVVPQIMSATQKRMGNYGWARTHWHAKGPLAQGPVCVANASGAVMLLRMSAKPHRQWFDPTFFLYYEDEDLCLGLFQQQQAIVLEPSIFVTHLNRSSVKGDKPWRLEYLRGYHHARSKILITAKYFGEPAARRHRSTAMLQALALLAARVLLLSPRLLCRAAGRVVGLWGAPTAYVALSSR